MSPRLASAALVVACSVGCASVPTYTPVHTSTGGDILAQVTAIHGGHGPFVIAGFRMGERALRELALPRGSFDVEVVHESPPAVQWSCIADGVQAATGASVGRLNLRRVDSDDGLTRTRVRNRRTGAEVVLRPSEAFTRRYEGTPRERLDAAGREALTLPEGAVFELQRAGVAP